MNATAVGAVLSSIHCWVPLAVLLLESIRASNIMDFTWGRLNVLGPGVKFPNENSAACYTLQSRRTAYRHKRNAVKKRLF